MAVVHVISVWRHNRTHTTNQILTQIAPSNYVYNQFFVNIILIFPYKLPPRSHATIFI